MIVFYTPNERTLLLGAWLRLDHVDVPRRNLHDNSIAPDFESISAFNRDHFPFKAEYPIANDGPHFQYGCYQVGPHLSRFLGQRGLDTSRVKPTAAVLVSENAFDASLRINAQTDSAP